MIIPTQSRHKLTTPRKSVSSEIGGISPLNVGQASPQCDLVGHISQVLCLLSHEMRPLRTSGILIARNRVQIPTLCTWNIYLMKRTSTQSSHTGLMETKTLPGTFVPRTPADIAPTPLFSLRLLRQCIPGLIFSPSLAKEISSASHVGGAEDLSFTHLPTSASCVD